MSYLALFRKYRSQTFDDLIGQDHVVRTLRNSIAQGRIAQVYLFTGPRGTGKTSTARLLAKALNCTDGPNIDFDPDDPICQDITAGNCLDVIELDAASEAGVEKVRENIVEASEYRPAQCRYKIFIIDEVHDLSAKAFDALLKTIEEPPPHVIFVLATTEYHKVPATIRSRCQKFEFYRGSIPNLISRLNKVIEAEGFEAEPSAVAAIARLSDGGYRDALTLLEQAMVTADGNLTLEHIYDQLGLLSDETTDSLIAAIAEGDLTATVNGLEEVYRRGRDPQAIIESLMYRLADLTRAQLNVETGGDPALDAALTSAANRIGSDKLLRMRVELSSRHKAVREVSIPRIWLEAECLKIALSLQNRELARPVATPRQEVEPKHAVTTQPAATKAPEPRDPKPASTGSKTDDVASPKAQPAKGANVVQEAMDQLPTGLEPGAEAWATLVEAASSLSVPARTHLAGSQIAEISGRQVSVRMKPSSAEYVSGKSSLIQFIRQGWQKLTGVDADFDFVAATHRPRASRSVETASVESPLEGDRLADVARRVFATDANGAKDA